MMRALYVFVMGLLLAGIVHIVVVLLVPRYAERDAWERLQNAPAWQFSRVASPGRIDALVPFVDPAFAVAACRFDLSEAPLLAEAQGRLPYWSVAIYDSEGENVYSFNDRTAVERRLRLLVVDPVQLAQLRKSAPAEMQEAVVVPVERPRGFVLVRALREDESWSAMVDTFLKDATCSRYEIVEASS